MFKEFFQYTKPKEILNQYKLYEFKEFRRYIETVPGYKEHIQETHKELKTKSKRKKKLENVKEIIEEMYNVLVEQEEQINQLQSLHTMYTDQQVVRGAMCKILSKRLQSLKSSIDNKNLERSLCYETWSGVSPEFVQHFKLNDISSRLNGIAIQHVVKKEFHDIAKETAYVWKVHNDNTHIQELVERNVTCIKKGMAKNGEGKIEQALQFADIAWTVLDHVQAVGEGMVEGTGNVVYAFAHPIKTVQNTAETVYNLVSLLGRATIEVTDMCILCVTDQPAAQQKLQTWKYGFTQVIDKAYKQYQNTSNRDITKFISSFSTEIFVTGKATHALKSFFSFARNKGAKLIQKAHELSEVSTVTTPEGITAQVNKAVKHTKGSSQKYITIGRVGKEIKKTIEGKVYILIPRLNLRWLRMKYDNILRFKDKLVTIAYEHIFGIEVNPTANSSGVVRYNWSGLHNDFWNELKRDRIISLKNKAKSGTSGFYTAEVTYKGVTNKKTFFPSNWRPNEVVEKIIEAYKNFNGVPEELGNGRFKIESFTNEGVKIRIIMQENISTAKIITAYPVLDELIN